MKISTAGGRLKAVALLSVTLSVSFLLSGSQCARVDDRALAPSVSSQSDADFRTCIRACQDASQDARRLEQDRFVTTMQECGDADCRRQAVADHQANLDRIEADEALCKSGCHEQGSGVGGQ